MALTENFPLAGADPFYSYQEFQQDPSFDYTETPVIGGPAGYLETNQDAAYTRFLGKLGLGLADQSTPFGRYVWDQFRNTQLGFKAALAEDPTLQYQDYLTQLGTMQDFYNRFSALSPRQRGVRLTGPTRTIADI